MRVKQWENQKKFFWFRVSRISELLVGGMYNPMFVFQFRKHVLDDVCLTCIGLKLLKTYINFSNYMTFIDF